MLCIEPLACSAGLLCKVSYRRIERFGFVERFRFGIDIMQCRFDVSAVQDLVVQSTSCTEYKAISFRMNVSLCDFGVCMNVSLWASLQCRTW